MALGMEVGLGPTKPHCARWRPSSLPPKRGQSPRFSARVYCGQTAAWIKMPLDMLVGLGPGDFVFDGVPATPEIRAHHPTQFLAHVYCGHGRPSQLLLRCSGNMGDNLH